MKQLALMLIKLYQRTGFLRPPCCRFYPPCSTYTARAIEKNGLFKGLMLGAWRLLRCQPLHPGGIDEVPGWGDDHGSTTIHLTNALQ